MDGIVVSVALLKQERMLEKATLVGLHEFLDFDGQIFLDSGSYEDFIANKKLRPETPNELMFLAKWLRVNMVSHLDMPFIGENAKLPEDEKWALLNQNILNAKITYELSKEIIGNPCVVYIIQGWNQESIAYCTEELVEMKVAYYALGSLSGLPPKEIVARVRLVREIIGASPKLHLFAVTNPDVIKEVKSLVDSVDSATASIAGAMKEIIKSPKGRSHIDHYDLRIDCDCPICRKYGGAIFLQGRRGMQNYYNQLRKVHNAYQLLRNLRNVGATCE